MEFVKSVDSEQLDKWLIQNNASYLQSSLWQRILLTTGQNVERVEVRENGEIVAGALLIYKKLPFGWKYAFCPKGPVVVSSSPVIPNRREGSLSVDRIEIPRRPRGLARNDKVYDALVKYLKKQNCIFLRFEPVALSKDLSIKPAKEINPSATLVLDIQKSADELLAEMHTKTRYNIRVAERKGLKVSHEKNFQIFWDLLQKTGARDNFVLHSKNNYEKVMADQDVQQITISTPEGKAIASGGFIGFGDRYYYLYGALNYEDRNLMAPYLLQWTAIQQGKKLGYKYYDFFGIAPPVSPSVRGSAEGVFVGESYQYDPKHIYAGITRFKLGFGGAPENAPGTFDLLIDPKKYRIYKLLRKLRKLLP